jgi:error-prone DNA polymerase
MPEHEFPKLKPHPFKADETPFITAEPAVYPYAELCVTSNYTFLTGASHPEEFVGMASLLGYRAIAATDTHSLAGVVRAHTAAKETGIRFVLGTRLILQDVAGCSLLVYPTDKASYGRLCRLLTVGKRRAPKGECHLQLEDLAAHAEGLLAILVPGEDVALTEGALQRLRPLFDDDRLSLAGAWLYGPDDASRLERLAAYSQLYRVPLVAINDAHAHGPDRRMLQDILTCIRHVCTLDEAGYRLHANAERHLKPPHEMHRLFAAYPQAIRRTMEIVERTAGFSLDQLVYQYPQEVVPEGHTPDGYLEKLTWLGAAATYPQGVPEKVRHQIERELTLIAELHYAPYFLTVHDLVHFARSQGILCQGRGAAANSAVCFCLGVTAVDPSRIDLLFERFVSKERNEPPDIDIDFEHERREEVIQYIYRKYGRERAALTAEVITYRHRSAIRDVGKALGLSLDAVDRLAKDIEWWDSDGLQPKALRAMGLNPEEPTLQWLVRLATELLGFPRHLSQHVGGFVITQEPLCELVPVENAAMPDRTVIEWDKDDIDAMGMLKIDVLGLGMLTAIRKAIDLVNAARPGQVPLTLATIPPEDPATYAMIQKADTIGVFQIESRAQMSMLPRLKPKEFYDLVIEVAIVRPGPIQGDMVHPYLRRRNGDEEVHYVHPAIEEVLKKTLGVPLFQEQCMALAVKAAGFTPGEADQLRRAMAAWKRKGDLIYRFGQKLIDGMASNGIPREYAERCFEQIKGFSEYGFPESHAASFALLVYASAWLKCHWPAHFTAALLNSLPMGFYAPAQLVRCATEHGVTVRPVDVHHSRWDCTIEQDALRLGMRLVSGLGQPDADKIAQAVRTHGKVTSVERFWRLSGSSSRSLRKLAAADAFRSMGLDRQQALWQARSLRDDVLPLFDRQEAPDEHAPLPVLAPSNHVVLDYASTGLSLKAHPVSFVRPMLARQFVRPCVDLQDAGKTPDGDRVRVAGLVLVRQRPGTAKEVTFMTIEDETGIANLVVWSRVYERYRAHARAQFLIAHGRVQRAAGVVHVVIERLERINRQLEGLAVDSRNFH